MREWFYAHRGQQQGPVPESELIEMLATGRLKPDTLVWTDGFSDWTPVGDIEALAPASNAPPPLPASGAVRQHEHGHAHISGFGWYLEGLRQYAVFDGRSRRSAFWFFLLFDTIFTLVTSLADTLLFGTPFEDYGPICVVYTLATIVPYLAVAVRRMHDTGHSGWWIFAPIVNLVFYCRDSDPGDNAYGPNPKGM